MQKRYFLYFDLDQAEPRMLARLTGDPNLIKLCVGDEDFYKATYALVDGTLTADEVTNDQRKEAKIMFLATIYSLGNAGFIAQTMNCSFEEASEKFDRFKQTFEVAWKAIDDQIELVLEKGYQVIYGGRRVKYDTRYINDTLRRRIINN